MASLTSLFILALLSQHGASLQVTPNSPCASFCLDSNDLDFSDPNSSNTKNKDITCHDSEYNTSPAGQKFQRCISCLQDSDFAQDSESDQLWFLYNLRYTFDYCIFGFPNAKDIASTPCSTSMACGGLQTALIDGQLDAEKADYSFCSADGDAMTGPLVSKCLSCVSASDGQDYLANYLIALETGCKQRPPAGTLIGLNDTVFSKTSIIAIDAAAEAAESEKKSTLEAPAIAGIAVGAVAILLIAAGFFFVRHRKRRNRVRLEGHSPAGRGHQNKRHRASTLSFRCQTHLSPRSPAFHRSNSTAVIEEEKSNADPSAALGSHPLYSPESPMSSVFGQPTWQSRRTSQGFRPSHKPQNNINLPLHAITTTAPAPTVPSSVYHSTSPRSSRFSPVDDAATTTPASTTSTKSTAQLLPLKPYNPADYGVAPPLPGGGGGGGVNTAAGDASIIATPPSGTAASPLMGRAWDYQRGGASASPPWGELPKLQPPPPRGSSRQPVMSALERASLGLVVGGGSGSGKGKRVSSNANGSPVEASQINTSFPGPPSTRR